MKNWKVEYAYRKNGEYFEDSIFVRAPYLDSAYREASVALSGMSWAKNWDEVHNGRFCDRFLIWNIGLVAEADEEVF